MGSNINNDFLKKLQETVMNNTWMSELYGSERAEQQSKLKGVFTVVAENNVTTEQRKALEKQAESIQEKVERLEAKMAVLEEELAKNQSVIAEHAKKITDLVGQAESAQDTLETKQQEHVKDIVEDVFYELEQGIVGKDDVVPEIRKRLKDDYILKKYGNAVEKILGQLDAKEAEVANLVASADKWIDQKKLLQSQYGATKSTYDLLNAGIKKIGVNETTYTNSDFDAVIPTYSPVKADVVSKFSENPAINVEPGKNPNYIEGSQAPSLESLDTIKEKYQDLLGTAATPGSEKYSSGNEAVANLGKALDMGLFADLTATGLSANQVADFIAENFSGAMITKSGSNLTIPYGHDSKAREIYSKLKNEIKNYNSTFQGALNTWDENCGNTISSNKQIESLAQNYDEILSTMKDSGFTFKEAMFALFDPDYGMFKNSGVSYNVDKQGEIPNYFIQFAGDEETANMYKGLSDKIYDIWGVKPSRGLTVDEYNDDTNDSIGGDVAPDGDDTEVSTSRSDPIWFSMGDNKNDKYSFVIDRDGDGAFTSSEDFVGGSANASWLDDLRSLDTDGDGKLTGDELKELKILGTKYTDNAASVTDNNEYTPDKTASNKNFNRQDTTKIEYTLSSAASMGIEEIDLANLEGQVNQTQNIFDVNGSEKFSDSFTFKMNGQEITAHRQDETKAFMDTVYGDVYGKGFQVGLSDNQVDEVFLKDYGEFDQFSAKYSDVFNNINILKNAGNIAKEARAEYQDTLDRIAENENVELIRAGNKAAATKEVAGWSSLSQDIQHIAIRDGIVIDMNQAKGIYVLDGSLDAEGIVQRYKEQVQNQQDIIDSRAMQKEAFKAIILVAQAGIETSADEIKELLKSGKASTAQDVLNILQEKVPQGVDVKTTVIDIGFDSEREQEIFEAFNKVFNEAGLDDKVVDALAELCVEQQNNDSFMLEKTGEELAKQFLQRYQ